ncbi:MAG: hypothetical protein QMC70_05175, partial [Bacteroidia bacterium]
MKTVVQIAWVLGIVVVAILVAKLSYKDVAKSDIQLMDVAPFLLELAKESDELYAELAPIGFDQASHPRAVQLRKDRWYILGIEQGNLTYWNSNKVGIDTSILALEQYPVLYRFGDDVYAVFKKSTTNYFAFRLANDGKIHPRLAKHADSFSNKQLAAKALAQEITG